MTKLSEEKAVKQASEIISEVSNFDAHAYQAQIKMFETFRTKDY